MDHNETKMKNRYLVNETDSFKAGQAARDVLFDVSLESIIFILNLLIN